ncbi:SDR family NAD(P)-dependent oxidoreductase [Niveispirillum irakense]|uniref:SDR family NAD(P)-dependent oxidoreductase n=1 Tax=Niveispirillum irakense TaxID=34011 RepID=UPI000414998E|nr:glucose 1-dehydrogenase [Niveispirillum irakense]
MKLKDKVAIVTGGGRDIGRAVSQRLAAEGAAIMVNYYNDADSAAETVSAIQAAGGRAIAHRADMTRPEEVDGLVAATKAAFGDRVDLLVNVTGGLVARKLLADMDADFFSHVMDLNVKSAFLATKAVVPLMQQGGAIVNFSSQAGRDGGGFGASAYATAKGAVMTFTRAMAKELGPSGIRVNAVCPGMISTSFHDLFTKAEVRKNVAGSTPLRREGEATEVADLVAWLVSAEAGFVTGACIDINGGTFFS